MLQNMWTIFLAKVATVGDHIHFGFFGRIPHEVTFKVDGIGRGSINQKRSGPRPLGSSVHTFLSHLSVEEPFTFLGGRTVVDPGGNYILEPICCKTLALSVCCGPFSSVAFDATSLDTTHKNSA